MQTIFTKQKLISLGSAIFVLVLFYILNPAARNFSSFFNNYNRTTAINNCIKEATSTSKVLEVIDGDTIDVLTPSCGVERVRLIGINTPETVDPNRPVQCYGKEASNEAKQLLSHQNVIVQGDPTQDMRDKYGRLLGYVFLQDGTLFNEFMVRQGFAFEYTYQIPYQYQKEFKQAQLDAQSELLGLWSPSTCNGQK